MLFLVGIVCQENDDYEGHETENTSGPLRRYIGVVSTGAKICQEDSRCCGGCTNTRCRLRLRPKRNVAVSAWLHRHLRGQGPEPHPESTASLVPVLVERSLRTPNPPPYGPSQGHVAVRCRRGWGNHQRPFPVAITVSII